MGGAEVTSPTDRRCRDLLSSPTHELGVKGRLRERTVQLLCKCTSKEIDVHNYYSAIDMPEDLSLTPSLRRQGS